VKGESPNRPRNVIRRNVVNATLAWMDALDVAIAESDLNRFERRKMADVLQEARSLKERLEEILGVYMEGA